MTQPIERILSALRDSGGSPVTAGRDQWAARCPQHIDDVRSLSIGISGEKVLVSCHAGCATQDILGKLNLPMTSLFEDAPERDRTPKVVETYDYVDEQGDLLYQVLRYEPKSFKHRRPTADGGWSWSMGNTRKVLYKLPDVLTASKNGGACVLVEGESDVHTLNKLGFVATSSSGGAANWRPEFAEALRGCNVAIIPDNDEPGKEYASAAARSLYGRAKSIRIVTLSDLPPHGDVSDWMADHTLEELKIFLNKSPIWTPETEKANLFADPIAERTILGAIFTMPKTLANYSEALDASDFSIPAHQALWRAWLELWKEGTDPDFVSLTDRSRLYGGILTASQVAELSLGVPPVTREHIDIVLKHQAERQLLLTFESSKLALEQGKSAYDVADGVKLKISQISDVVRDVELVTFDDVIDAPEADDPWIVRGMLRRSQTAVIVAAEGIGKAVNMRCIAACSAQGVHPYKHAEMHAVRSLYVDLQDFNGVIRETGQVLRRALQEHCGQDYNPDNFAYMQRPTRLNIRNRRDRSELASWIAKFRPDLVCVGPLNNLYFRKSGENYEDAAGEVTDILDDLRIRYGFALVIEHHAPKGDAGKHRDLVPFGSQRWMAWPNFGITLSLDREVGTPNALLVGRYRSGDRGQVWWPDTILRDPYWVVTGRYLTGDWHDANDGEPEIF